MFQGKLARAYPLPALEEPHTPGEELTLRQHSWCLCSLKLAGRTSNRVGRSAESLLWSVFATETQTRSAEFTGSYWGHAWEVSVGQCGGLVRECCRGEDEMGSDLGISRKPVMEWFLFALSFYLRIVTLTSMWGLTWRDGLYRIRKVMQRVL